MNVKTLSGSVIPTLAALKEMDWPAMPTSVLVAVYNDATGKSIKKFSDRATAEKQILKLIEDVPKPEAKPEAKRDNSASTSALKIAKERQEGKKRIIDEKAAKKSAAAAKKADAKAKADASKAAKKEQREKELAERKAAKSEKVSTKKKLLPNFQELLDLGTACPYCGDTANGITYDDEEGKETEYRHCHVCSTSFSSEDGHLRKGKAVPSADRSAAVAQSWADPAVKEARSQRHHVKADGVAYSSVANAFRDLGLAINKVQRVRLDLKSKGKLTFEGHHFVLVLD